MQELRNYSGHTPAGKMRRVGLPLAVVLTSSALGLIIAYVWLSPTSRETMDLAFYLVASGIVSIAVLEVALRSSRVLPALRFRPKLLVALTCPK